MKTTRQRILDFILLKDVVTSEEVASALHMTASNARHHLSRLVSEGALQIVGDREPSGRGRPAQLYRLSSSVNAHALDILASILLMELFENAVNDPARTEQILNQIANKMVVEISGPHQETTPRSLAVRLNMVVRKLAAMHYQPRWEAHSRGPRLVLGHCPYAQIWKQYPQICKLDEKVVEAFVKAKANLSEIRAEVSPGIFQCVMMISEFSGKQ